MATHSSVLAWRIPGMGEPGGLLSMGSHRVGHYWSDLVAAAVHIKTTQKAMKLAASLGKKVNKIDKLWKSDKETKKTHEIPLDALMV